MSYHFGPSQYEHLNNGYVLSRGENLCRYWIKSLRYSPDSIYQNTDGHAGNAFCVDLIKLDDNDNKTQIFVHFRHFGEIAKIYGEPIKNSKEENDHLKSLYN